MLTPYGDIPQIPDSPPLRITMKAPNLVELIRRELLFFKIGGLVDGYDGPGRFFHLKNYCDAVWQQPGNQAFKWHTWLEDQLEEYCRTNEVLVSGPACVAGHTRILDPTTGVEKPISELCKEGMPIHVMTLNGTVIAPCPFVKGVDELFEVTLNDGSKFTGTAKHIVLSSSGFVELGSLNVGSILLGYGSALPGSTLEHVPSTHVEGDPGSSRKSQDSQFDYPLYSCFCGEPLPCFSEDGEGNPTLPFGVQAHRFRRESRRDVPVHKQGHSRSCPSLCHPSILRNALLSVSMERFLFLLRVSANPLLYDGLSRWFGQSQRETGSLYSFPEQGSDCVRMRSFSEEDEPTPLLSSPEIETFARFQHSPQSACRYGMGSRHRDPVSKLNHDFVGKHCHEYESYCQYEVQRRVVQEIKSVGRNVFYDIQVPQQHHYFAEGAIHHNSGGKTTGLAIYFNACWVCSPLDTGVIVCSTTRDGLKKRLWGDIRTLFLSARKIMGNVGRLVDSDLVIQSAKGDTKHGIFGFAVAQGEEQKALGRIIGFHPRRIFVGVDELTDVSWAIIEALTNLFTGKQKAQFVGIGNAALIFDSHGKMCEPNDGWNSVNVESDRWETKRGGVCLHFDGFKCENVVQGKRIHEFLLTQEDIDKTATQYGMNSPQMWRMRRGFWCPEGTTKTVLNDSLIRKFLAMEKATWEGAVQRWAGLDPAFEGGDRCILRFSTTGRADNGLDTFELGEIVCIKTDVRLKDPLHYQIARQVKEECEKRFVDPPHFGMDVTGEGGGLASIISEEWGPGFHQVEFGGKASDLPVSEINDKPCNKEYYDKVTELWYSFRAGLMLNQVRGLDPETATEFCNRLYTVDGTTWIESKKDMKARPGNRSPDLADAACILWDTAKHRGGMGKALSMTQRKRETEWLKAAREYEDNEDDAYTTDGIEAVI